MGIIKDNNYSKQEIEIGQVFDAMSHPARRRIMNLLRKELIIRNVDLCKLLNLSPTAVMNHLNKLKRAKLITVNYDIHYHEIILVKERLRIMSDYLDLFY